MYLESKFYDNLMGKYLIAAAYSLAAFALVGIAIFSDSVKYSQPFRSKFARTQRNPTNLFRNNVNSIQASVVNGMEYSLFDLVDNNRPMLNAEGNPPNSSGLESIARHIINSVDNEIFIRKDENFSYNPLSENKPEYPDWTPVQIPIVVGFSL